MKSMLPDLPTAPGSKVHVASRISPHLEYTNPGDTAPSRQQFARPLIDQAMSVTMSSAALRNSNGESQRKDIAPGQQGVIVSAGSSGGRSFSGDDMKTGAKKNQDQGTRVETGMPALAENVFPGDQNVSKQVKMIAESLPTFGELFDGGASSGRGVPKNFNVR